MKMVVRNLEQDSTNHRLQQGAVRCSVRIDFSLTASGDVQETDEFINLQEEASQEVETFQLAARKIIVEAQNLECLAQVKKIGEKFCTFTHDLVQDRPPRQQEHIEPTSLHPITLT